MSGFLQRLARGVLQSEQTLHPDVGSIWSAPRVPEPIETSSEILVRSSPRHPDAPTAQPVPTVRDRAPRYEVEQPTISRIRLESDLADTPAFKPLVELPQQKAVFVPSALQHPAEASRRGDAIPTADQSERPPELAPEFPIAQRPLPGEPARSPMPTLRIASPVAAPPHESSPFPRQLHAAPPQASEPDSIEIHIGRIEVLAAPQRPAQPAAPPPARKSLDLVDYLRRDRRAQ